MIPGALSPALAVRRETGVWPLPVVSEEEGAEFAALLGGFVGLGIGHSRKDVWKKRSALPLVHGVYGDVRSWTMRRRRGALRSGASGRRSRCRS